MAQIGSMIEEPAFYPWMSGRVNLEVLGATGGGCAPGEVDKVLGLLGLGDVAARKVKTYSQGMRQRLGIAAAMLGRPPLLILDESANGLDPAGIRDIRGLLRGLAAEGTTVFLCASWNASTPNWQKPATTDTWWSAARRPSRTTVAASFFQYLNDVGFTIPA